MKTMVLMLAVILGLAGTVAQADTATEQEVRQAILDASAYIRKNLKSSPGEYSKDGAIEFWSSGGLMQNIPAGERPAEWNAYNIHPKHIRVTALVPGKVAMAHFYAEGSMHPKNSPAVHNYRTRVSQVFVKEDGKWKVRASHWSAMAGGSGTSQNVLEP